MPTRYRLTGGCRGINPCCNACYDGRMKSFILLFTAALAAQPALPQSTPQRPATLWLIGDSTVRNGSGTGSNGQWGWGDKLTPFFDPAKLSVVNKALGGRSSRTYITEGHWDEVL